MHRVRAILAASLLLIAVASIVIPIPPSTNGDHLLDVAEAQSTIELNEHQGSALRGALIATFTLFTAVGYWNEWFWSTLLINSGSKMTLQVVLKAIVAESAALEDVSTGEAGMDAFAQGIKMAVDVHGRIPAVNPEGLGHIVLDGRPPAVDEEVDQRVLDIDDTVVRLDAEPKLTFVVPKRKQAHSLSLSFRAGACDPRRPRRQYLS